MEQVLRETEIIPGQAVYPILSVTPEDFGLFLGTRLRVRLGRYKWSFKNHKYNQFYLDNLRCVQCHAKCTEVIFSIEGKNRSKKSPTVVFYCANERTRLTVDHIMPKSMGGEDYAHNYQTLCLDCNRLKGTSIRI